MGGFTGISADDSRAQLAPGRNRDLAFDVLKGIGIVEVLFHHTLSFSARKFTAHQSVEWWMMTIANRILHFAIPTFLLISALLLVRSLTRHDRPDLKHYFKQRAFATLVPYLIWTVVYLLFRFFVLRVGSDVVPGTWTVPGAGWVVTGPSVFLDPEIRTNAFLWGKGYFHLYFFCVLIQLSLLLPFIALGLKRYRPKFSTLLSIAVVLQLAFFFVQSYYLKFATPASLVLSYIPAVAVGAWLGMNWSQWDRLWFRIRIPTAIVAVLAGLVYLGKSIVLFDDGQVINVLLNIAFSAYATSAALLLLAWAKKAKPEGRLTAVLSYLGSLSLPIFVMHPMALYFLGGPTISRFLDFVPYTPFWIFGMVLVTTLTAARVLSWLRLDKILFGRKLTFDRLDSIRPVSASSMRP